MRCCVLPIGLLAGLTVLSACQPTHLSADALAKYVADPANHLRQVQQTGNTEVSVTYQPVDLLIARELSEPPYRPSAVDSLRKKYQDATFFVLAIARNQREVLQPTEGFSDYSELLQTLAFRMSDRVRVLTSQGDTLRPANYYLDRTYASASATQLLFAFPRLPPTGTWRFQLQECGLETGNLQFAFETSAIAATPALAN